MNGLTTAFPGNLSERALTEKFENERRQKLEEIRASGVDPYGGRYDGAEPVADIAARATEGAEARGRVAGRMTALRDFGKAAFADLRDWTGKIQVLK